MADDYRPEPGQDNELWLLREIQALATMSASFRGIRAVEIQNEAVERGMAKPRKQDLLDDARRMGVRTISGGDEEGNEDTPGWTEGLLTNNNGYPVWCAENVLLFLENDPEWAGVIAFNEFSMEMMLMKPIPGSKTPRKSFKPKPIRDSDIDIWALRWFNRKGFPDASKTMLRDAFGAVAFENAFHPVREYLEGLVWDGVPRLKRMMSDYFGAEDNLLNRQFGRRWMISGVARILQPGCKVDTMLVLEGKQGTNKSRALGTLAGDDWFSDSMPDMHSKAASQHIRGKWIIEVAEMSAWRKSDIEAFKAFMTRRIEKYRPPYGRQEVIEYRQSIFAGSINAAQYLEDPTGNRRIWPVACDRIDIDAIIRDRDQLWAEAVRLFRSGRKWWLPRKLEPAAQDVQSDRLIHDDWEPLVRQMIKGRDEISTLEIARSNDGLALMADKIDRVTSLRLANILRRLGWDRPRGKGSKITSGPYKDAARFVPTK